MTKYNIYLLGIEYTEGFMSLSDISKRFGVPYKTLQRYKKKYNWKALRDEYIERFGYKPSILSNSIRRVYVWSKLKDKAEQLAQQIDPNNPKMISSFKVSMKIIDKAMKSESIELGFPI